MTPLRTIQDIIRQRMRAETPGFAGGYLSDRYSFPDVGPQPASDTETRPRVLGRTPPPLPTPTPVTSAPPPPTPGTPTSMAELGPPPAPPVELAPPNATRMRASYDPRTGEPHREFYERGKNPLAEKTAYRNALQQWQPRGGRSLREILKSAGVGALMGLGSGSSNPLAAAIGGAAAGGLGQVVRPSYGGSTMKQLKLQRANSDIDNAINEDYRQAMTDRMKVATQEAQADLVPDPQNPGRLMRRPQQRDSRIVERSDGVYEISSQYPDGRKLGNIPAEAKKSRADIRYFEREDGVYGVYEDSEGNAKSFKVSGIPGKPASDAQSAQAAEGTALAESTQQAYDSLKGEVDQHKTQLKDNERAIREKNAWLNRRATELLASVPELQAAAMSNPKAAREAALERAKAEDEESMQKQGLPAGNFDELLANTESLKDAIKEKEKRLSGMEQDIRQGKAKGARSGKSASAGVTLAGAVAAFKQKAGREPTAAEIDNIKRYYGLQ